MANDDWMLITVQVPADDGLALLMHLKEKMGFTAIDRCVLQRADRARVDYDPCPPLTTSGYTIDPFPPPS
jgi:hypothetical protein